MKNMNGIEMKTIQVEDDGRIPNHPKYPLLIYKNAFEADDDVTGTLKANNWLGAWKGSVLPYHHYHSNTHETLVVDEGTASLMLGGEMGEEVTVEAGDVAILPAGYGHMLKDSSSDFAIIGTYPDGKDYDMCYGRAEDRAKELDNIKNVPLPDNDPLYGADGPLFTYWGR